MFDTLTVYLQFLDLKKRFNWFDHGHEKLGMISAKRLDLVYSNNKEKFLPLINTKLLRGTTLSTLWQEVTKQIRQLELEVDELSWRLSQEANEAVEDQREILVTEVTSEIWRRDEQSAWFTTLGRRHMTKSRICWIKVFWLVFCAVSRPLPFPKRTT